MRGSTCQQLLLGVVLCLASANLHALDLELIGGCGGDVNTITLDGDRAYVGEGLNLVVYDVSGYGFPRPPEATPPEEPARLGSLFMHGLINAIAVYRNVAYVAAGAGGLQLVDIGSPQTPRLLGSYALPGRPGGLQMTEGIACVSWDNAASDTGGVEILSLSDPEHPAVLSSSPLPAPGQTVIRTRDDLLVQWASHTGVTSGFDVLDLGDLSAPSTILSSEFPAFRLLAASDLFLLCSISGDLLVVDAADPGSFTLLGVYSDYLPSTIRAATLDGYVAYVAGDDGFATVSLQSPYVPFRMGGVTLLDKHRALAVDRGVAYVGGLNGGLDLIAVSDPWHPEQIASRGNPGQYIDLELEGTRVYQSRVIGADYYSLPPGTMAEAGFDIVDVSVPSTPVRAGGYVVPMPPSPYFGAYYSLSAIGATVYGVYSLGDDLSNLQSTLEVIDTNDPAAPVVQGRGSLPGFAMATAAQGNTVYISGFDPNANGGLSIVDVSDPGNLTLVDHGIFASDYIISSQMEIDGEELALGWTDWNGYAQLKLIGIHPGQFPEFDGAYPEVAAYNTDILDLSLSHGIAYVLMDSHTDSIRMEILDIREPRHPRQLGGYAPESGLYSLAAVAGMYTTAFVGTRDGTVQAIDVADPSAPAVRDTLDTGARVTAMKTQDGLVYVLGQETGLMILDSHRYPVEVGVSGQGATLPEPGYYEFDANPAFAITALPESGWMLDHWEGAPDGAGASNPLVFDLDRSRTITAVFAEIQYALTIGKLGHGYTDPLPGTHSYVHDSAVSVTAIPEDGWRFDHWEGTGAGDALSNPLHMTLTADAAITAVFEPVQVMLTIAAGAGGSTSPAPGVHGYFAGETLSVAALPEDGWRFDHWEGDAGGHARDNPLAFTLSADASLTAVFTPIVRVLTTAVEGNGSISPPPGEHGYPHGTELTLSATPAAGWAFGYWSVDASKSAAPEMKLTLKQDLRVTAVFLPLSETITILTSGNGSTHPAPGTHAYPEGAPLSIQALPAEGWAFSHWLHECSMEVHANPTAFLAGECPQVEAVFVPIQHTLAISVQGKGACSPEQGLHVYAYATPVSVYAAPQAGWVFDHWEGDAVLSTHNPAMVLMGKDATLTAIFVEAPASILDCHGASGAKTAPGFGDLSVMGGTVLGLLLFVRRKPVRP